MKNTVLLHERTKFWIDITRSPRFSAPMIDNAINIAINSIISNRFIPEVEGNKKGTVTVKGFQRTKQLRDELKPLVKSVTFTATQEVPFTNNVLLNAHGSFPADYAYYTLFELIVNGKKVYPVEIAQEMLRSLTEDPYARPNIGNTDNAYFCETSTGFQFYIGANTITSVNLYYLAKQTTVFYGFENTLVNIANSTPVIITQESCTIGTTNYKYGDETTRPARTLTSTEEPIKVVTGSIPSEMPNILFDEIAKNAAQVLLMTVEKTMIPEQQ